VTFREAYIDFEVHADGTSVQTIHVAMEAPNDSIAQRIAQQPIVYSSSRERLTVLDAYTQKPDGSRLRISPEAIRTEPVPGSSNFPLFNDLHRTVMIFPAVAAHDLLVYTATREVKKPLIHEQFVWHAWLNRTVNWQDYRVTIRSPATKPLTLGYYGMDVDKQQDGDQLVYHIRAAYPNALKSDPAAIGPFGRLPWLAVSSLANYGSMVTIYSKVVEPKEDVTPEIQHLAHKLTSDMSNRYDEARAIYDWVSTHIRYVGIWLEQGAVEPHTASAVLQAGYGDCKDHAVLFAALLRARGIDSEPVLINLGNEYALAGPPTFAVLNHMITWLPEFHTYADTTAAFAPFGVLPFEEYGKPVVHLFTPPSERKTPSIPPGLAVANFSTHAVLASDGTISGESSTFASGPFSVVLRRMTRNVEVQGQEQTARAQLKLSDEEGTGSFGFRSPDTVDDDYTVAGHFLLDAQPEFLDGTMFVPPTGLRLLGRPGDVLLGPLTRRELPDTEPTPCHSGTQTETLSLALPQGWRAIRIPTDMALDNELLHYESRWSTTDGMISVRREMISKLPGPLCDGETRREIAKALTMVRRDFASQIGISQTKQ
jgi:transglutaminase-like putative cysteine protease